MQTDITSIVFKERCAFNARAKQWQGELRQLGFLRLTARCEWRRVDRPLVAERLHFYRLANASTSGNCRTLATNFASNGDMLSFRQIRASGSGRFKSVTGSTTTLSGHRQRVALLTNATPSLHDTRLRMVASFTASWTMCGDLRPPRKHSCINRS